MSETVFRTELSRPGNDSKRNKEENNYAFFMQLFYHCQNEKHKCMFQSQVLDETE